MGEEGDYCLPTCTSVTFVTKIKTRSRIIDRRFQKTGTIITVIKQEAQLLLRDHTTFMSLSSAKSREIPRKFELIALQGHPWRQSKAHNSNLQTSEILA